MSCWEYLPPELFYHIAEYLDDDDWVSGSGVCSEWYSNINEFILPRLRTGILRAGTQLLSVREDINTLHLVNFKDSLDILSEIPLTVTKLCFSMDEVFSASDNWIDSLKPIHDGIISIKFKNINFDSDSCLRLLDKFSLNVKTLVFDLNELSKKTMSNLEAVKELFSCLCFKVGDKIKYNFAGRNLNRLYTISDSVRHAEISGYVIEKDIYFDLLNEKHNLHSIKISEGFTLTFEVIKMLSKLKCLRHLEIEKAYFITDDEWSSCFKSGFKKLKILKITGCKGLADLTIESFIFLKQLKELEIEILNCSHIDRAFSYLLLLNLDNFLLHTKVIWLSSVIDYLNCLKSPPLFLSLFIHGPITPEFLQYRNKTCEIKTICKELGIKLFYMFRFTEIKMFFME